MIERMVLLKLKDEWATDAGRAAIVEHSMKVLPAVPQVRAVHVGVPADEASERSWDIALVIHLDSVDVLPAYAADPLHADYVANFLAPKVECKKAWNFRI